MPKVGTLGLLGAILVGGLVSHWLERSRPVGREVVLPALAGAARAASGSYEESVGSADVTIVFYSDYQCSICRSADPVLRDSVERDGNVRVIYKEWPILGAQSNRAAEVVLAAKRQNLYAEVHNRLMKAPLPLNEDKLRRAVEESGGDWSQILSDLKMHSTDIQRLLSANGQEAVSLGLRGTPGYLVGSRVIEGSASHSELATALELARRPE